MNGPVRPLAGDLFEIQTKINGSEPNLTKNAMRLQPNRRLGGAEDKLAILT